MPEDFFIDQYRKKAAQADGLAQSGRSSGLEATAPFLRVIREMLALIEPDRKHDLLDVGCANGLVDIILSSVVRSVVCVEPVEELASLARLNLTGYGNVRVTAGHGAAVPAADAHFHRVLMLEVLQLISPHEARAVFRELRRVSRIGARIVIGSIPHADHRNRFLVPYLQGVREAAHLSDDQKCEIIARNERATWYEPLELVAWWRDLGCRAETRTPSVGYPAADHRFHLIVHVSR